MHNQQINMSPLDTTEKRIRELVPELQELSFGCEVFNIEENQKEIVWLTNLDMSKPEVYTNKTYPQYQASYRFTFDEDASGYEYKILGHPIQLHHVLQAIRDSSGYRFKQGYIGITANGQFIDVDADKLGTEIMWNLTKPYSEQSQEVKDFIGEIIKN